MTIYRHRLSRQVALAALTLSVLGAATVTSLTASAVPTPTISTTASHVAPNGTITINGTGCEPNGDATVDLGTGVGTPSENFWGNIYPIHTDANGAFTVQYTLTNDLADGTVITLIGQCPFTETGAHFAPITIVVETPSTTTSPATTETTGPATTTPASPTTVAVAPAHTAAVPAQPVQAHPTYTG